MSLELGAPFWPPEQTTRHIKLICSPNVAHLLPKLPHFFCTVNVIFRGQLGLYIYIYIYKCIYRPTEIAADRIYAYLCGLDSLVERSPRLLELPTFRQSVDQSC